LGGLQTASIIVALPFAIIMLGMCVSINMELKQELNQQKQAEKLRLRKIEKMLEKYIEDNDNN
ncbi:MAG: glycine/betaine ABC transporter permease, partial [Syntrophomonadaceae bacterium]|nr:glycine/betaine ABC transporter permease [Syntrophomonadaceae bacterium]